jgi:hypothetical protein
VTESSAETPLLRIVKGDPTPDEVAALVAVVSALAGAPGEQKPKRRAEWSARHRLVRRTLHHGPGAWRSSGLG